MVNNVRFFAGSKKQYLNLDEYSPLALYFCYDTRELFWGDLLISDGMRVVATYEALPELTEAADGVVYFVTETRNGYVLSNDRAEWIQVIQAPSGVGGNDVDLSDYLTKSETEAAIEKALAELEIPTIDGLATEEYVNNAIAALPKHEETDLTGYATQQWVIDQGYLTSHINIDGKADIDHKHDELYDKKGAAEAIKNELLNGAGDAYDTLKELGDLVKENKDTVDALRAIAADKADKEHEHEQYLTEHQSLEDYAKKEELFSGSYNDLTDKPEIPSIEGLATKDFVAAAINKIEIPETEIYKVDFNTPDYAKAVEAYNNGKILVLINAAPDINSYATMNYVSEKYITFTKFLISRSCTYGSFNTYYLHNDNTWELAKEVKLNKVEAITDADKINGITIGKETYTFDYATTETVNQINKNIENIQNNYVTNQHIIANYTTTEDLKATYITNNEVTKLVANEVEEVITQKIEDGNLAVNTDAINYDTW
jgi:hypothetical protein